MLLLIIPCPMPPQGQTIDFAIGSFLPTIVVTELLDVVTRSSILNKEIVDYILKENDQVYTYLSRLLTRLSNNKSVGVLVVDASRVSRTKVVSLLRRHNRHVTPRRRVSVYSQK